MRYPAIIRKEGRHTLAEFPTCPGCQTFAEPGEDIAAQASDALQGWLETHLGRGREPAPRPPARAPKVGRGERVLWVDVPAKLAVKLELRRARHAAGLTQSELAQRADTTQQAIARLEDPDANVTLDTLEKVAQALGVRLRVSLEAHDGQPAA